MRYEKQALPLCSLVDHLQHLGLGGDPDLILRRLQAVGYYRLSPYWRTFREAGSERIQAGVGIEQVWRLYRFDRELRLLTLDAIERVEVAARARLVEAQAEALGPFGYANLNPEGRSADHYQRLRVDIRDALARARRRPDAPHVSETLRHFASKYGDAHNYPPLWIAAEQFTFGDLVTLYNASPRQVRLKVAQSFETPEQVFGSWLATLQSVRNICAHHGRLWNRSLGVQPATPHGGGLWTSPALGPRRRIFFTLTILARFVGLLSDGSHWGDRFRALVEDRYPEVPHPPMGIGPGWKTHPIWADRLTRRT